MECISCQTEDPKNLVFEKNYWKIIISDEQACLGRCIVSCKRHVPSLSKLSNDEWNEFHDVVKTLEGALMKAFDARMFNWTCLMNDAYKKENPNPHVHWHFRPRYDHPVDFAGVTFEDKEFGHHYASGTNFKVSLEVNNKIIAEIRKYI
jgi:diadenosine tetraphosphate (Ap4A) HIT family hydrolase